MVIVGAGECGARAALTLREEGYDGPITLIGAEKSEIPYERPPLSKPAPDGGIAFTPVASAERLAEAGIDHRAQVTATGMDRAARRLDVADGAPIAYDRLLLATGSSPRTLPALDSLGAATFRTVADARRLLAPAGGPQRVVIVGAGLIGLELAATFRARGDAVTVLEVAPRALGRAVLPDLAEDLVARHRAEGVDMHFGVAGIAADRGALALADGRAFPADIVIVAIGVIPETGIAEAAGLVAENGIVVDECLRTADPHIYAAGDCAAVLHPRYGRHMRFESWRNAQDQGAAAARNMLGATEPFTRIPWFWSDQYDLGLQVAGLVDPALPTVTRELGAEARIIFSLDADGRLAAASGLGPGNAVARDIRLAEMLIEKGAAPDPAALTDPDMSLKKLLRA